MRFSGGADEDLASIRLQNFEYTVRSTLLTGYSSMPQFVSNINNEWMAGIGKPLNLFLNDSCDTYDAVSPILQNVMMPQGLWSYLIPKNGLLFLH